MTNLEIVQDLYRSFAAGNIEALLDRCSDKICWRVADLPNVSFGGVHEGKAAVAAFFMSLGVDEEITHFEPKEFFTQENKVVALGESSAIVRATQKPYSMNWVHVFTLEDGSITDFHEYFDNLKNVEAFL